MSFESAVIVAIMKYGGAALSGPVSQTLREALTSPGIFRTNGTCVSR